MEITVKDKFGWVTSTTYVETNKIALFEFGGSREVTMRPYALAWGIPEGGSISFGCPTVASMLSSMLRCAKTEAQCD